MALEDFDESGDQLELEMDKVDLSVARGTIDPNDPLDADLFDFPEMAVFDTLREVAEQQVAATAEATPAADEPASSEPGTTETSAATPPPSSPQNVDYDPKLDEDIFNFSEIFTGGDVVANAAGVQQNEEFVVPEAAATGELAPVNTQPAAANAEKPAPAADELRPVAPRASAEEEDELIALANGGLAPLTIPVAVEGSRDKLVTMLAVGFLVVNSALILLAWQANSSFHDTLRDVTRGITEGLSEVTNRPAQAAAPVQYVPVPSTGHQPRSADQRSSELHPMPAAAILAARELMGEGRYITARKNLYYLLANRDLIALPTEQVAEAEFLIAETYELQGTALLTGEVK
jgi:hypothetical protein